MAAKSSPRRPRRKPGKRRVGAAKQSAAVVHVLTLLVDLIQDGLTPPARSARRAPRRKPAVPLQKLLEELTRDRKER